MLIALIIITLIRRRRNRQRRMRTNTSTRIARSHIALMKRLTRFLRIIDKLTARGAVGLETLVGVHVALKDFCAGEAGGIVAEVTVTCGFWWARDGGLNACAAAIVGGGTAGGCEASIVRSTCSPCLRATVWICRTP